MNNHIDVRPDDATDIRVLNARFAKASRVATVILGEDATDWFDRYTDETWRILANAAGVTTLSPVSRELVRLILEDRRRNA